jgi:hypothetical protein
MRFGGGTIGGAGGLSGMSVDFFAASALAGGVSVGCAGGGWRRSAIGLRAAQPKKFTQRTQRAQSAQRGKNDGHEAYWRGPNCRVEMRLREPMQKNTDSSEFFKGPPAS